MKFKKMIFSTNIRKNRHFIGMKPIQNLMRLLQSQYKAAAKL